MPQEQRVCHVGEPITVYIGTCLAVGVATIEEDQIHRQMLCIRLAALPVDGVICLPLADLLIVAEEARRPAAVAVALSERVC